MFDMIFYVIFLSNLYTMYLCKNTKMHFYVIWHVTFSSI